jgi:hypothetical protein
MASLGNPLASLYPQPAQQPQNLLASNPLAALDIVRQLNANALFQQQFASQKGISSAFQAGVNPDGSVDPSRVAQGLQNPNITLGAGDAANTMLAQRQAQIGLAQQQFNLGSGQSQYVQGQLAALAAKPGATWNDLADTMTNIGAQTPEIPSSRISSFLAGVPQNASPAQIKKYVAQQGLGAAGPAFALSPMGATAANGSTANVPQGSTAYGGVPTSLAPGEAGALSANRTAYVNDQQNSANILGAVRPLQQAIPLIQQLNHTDFGPGSAQFSQLKGALETAGLIPQGSGAANELAIRQEVNKKLNQYISASPTANRSDAQLSQAISSNANMDLTQGAAFNLVKNKLESDLMDAALPASYAAKYPPRNGQDLDTAHYLTHKGDYYPATDQRAFSFGSSTPQERQAIVQSLGKPGSAAYQKFNNSLKTAATVGAFSPPGQQ